MEFSELRKRYWGKRFWVRGYFSTTSGNVTDDIITQYLELHSSKWMLPASAGSGSLMLTLQSGRCKILFPKILTLE